MAKTKPIKRTAAIVEFSKDHHYALLLIWKIREGFKNAIEPLRITRYLIHFFDSDLIHHFKNEEELLFSNLTEDNNLRIQAESEHEHIYRLIDQLKLEPGDKVLLQSFADSLEKHIRFEERELFNYLQDTTSESALLEIASSLKPVQHESDTAWADKFWVSKSLEV